MQPEQPSTVVVEPVPSGPRRPDALDWVMVGWFTVLAVLVAVFSVFFLPVYAGVVPVPVSAVIGAGLIYALIRSSYQLTRSMKAAFAPAVGWLAVSVWLSTSRTFGYGLMIGDWRAMLLLGLGALAAAVGVGLCWGWHISGQDVPGVTSADRAELQ